MSNITNINRHRRTRRKVYSKLYGMCNSDCFTSDNVAQGVCKIVEWMEVEDWMLRKQNKEAAGSVLPEIR